MTSYPGWSSSRSKSTHKLMVWSKIRPDLDFTFADKSGAAAWWNVHWRPPQTPSTSQTPVLWIVIIRIIIIKKTLWMNKIFRAELVWSNMELYIQWQRIMSQHLVCVEIKPWWESQTVQLKLYLAAEAVFSSFPSRLSPWVARQRRAAFHSSCNRLRFQTKKQSQSDLSGRPCSRSAGLMMVVCFK